MKTIALTGATGFVGSHIARALIEAPSELHLYVRRITPGIRALREKGATVHLETEARGGSVLSHALEGADTVIHCAAAIRALSRRAFFEANVALTRRILARMERHQTFLLISSQAAAGPSPPGVFIDETVPPSPVNDYGRSKLLAERLTRAWGRENHGHVLVLRPSSVYGPLDKDFYLLFKGIRRGLVLLPGNGRQRLSLLHVDDLVRATLAALEQGKKGETYFVTGEEAVSWEELATLIQAELRRKRVLTLKGRPLLAVPAAFFADALSRVTGKTGLLCRDKVLEMRQEAWLCSNRKIGEELGWRPRVSLEEGIERTAAWYIEEGWL